QRLTKERRTEIAYRRTQIHMVQQIVEVQRKGQTVAPVTIVTAAEAPKATAAATATAWTTATSSAATTATWATPWDAHAEGTLASLAAFSALTSAILRPASGFFPEGKCLTYSQINGHRTWSTAEVARNDLVSRKWDQIEIPKRRALDVCVIATGAGGC